MIRAIIFDFFDVFRTDAYKAWLAANNIPHEGPYFDASRQQDLGNITNQEFLQRLSELRGQPVTRAELDASATINHEMIALAAQLKKHYLTALLSNAPSAFLRDLLAEHNLNRYFDEIVISSEVGMVKPTPKIFEHTLSRLNVHAEEAAFIDDNAGHVRAAQTLGITGIQFLSVGQLRKELAALGILLETNIKKG